MKKVLRPCFVLAMCLNAAFVQTAWSVNCTLSSMTAYRCKAGAPCTLQCEPDLSNNVDWVCEADAWTDRCRATIYGDARCGLLDYQLCCLATAHLNEDFGECGEGQETNQDYFLYDLDVCDNATSCFFPI